MQAPIFLDFFLHVDMDAFFAAIEQRDRLELRSLPVIVCGASATRAVVSTCSYEARVFGVHSAMSVKRALLLCPQAKVVVGRMHHYRAVSATIMSILHRFSHQVEPLSVDEAFLRIPSAATLEQVQRLANEIKGAIFKEVGLSCSVGVASNKFLAKLASGQRKPAGLTIIEPAVEREFLASLPLKELYGVGRQMQRKLKQAGITTTLLLQQTPLHQLQSILGTHHAWQLYQLAKGVDPRGKDPIEPQNRSLGREQTFDWDTTDALQLEQALMRLCQRVWEKLQSNGQYCLTVRVKIKYSNFQEAQQQLTLKQAVISCGQLYRYAKRLFYQLWQGKKAIRLVGVSLSQLHHTQDNLLFDDTYEQREYLVERIANELEKHNIQLIKCLLIYNNR